MIAGFVEPLVQVTRSGRVESVHHGLAVIVDDSGRLVREWGDSSARIILRSAGKPFQAARFVESGAAASFNVDDRELAVAVGSHGGAPDQVAAVKSLMHKTETDPRELKCGTHPPFDRAARTISRRGGPTPLQNNCSGKHVAMIAGARHAGYPIDTYLSPANPWQRSNTNLFADCAGLDASEVALAVDGCGAPSFVVSARSAARAYAFLAAADEGPLASIWRAATGHPLMIAGFGRLETDLMEMFPGRILAKSGAEGVYAMAVRTDAGPRGAVLKIADGDDRRARTAAVIDLAAGLLELEPDELADLRAKHLPPIMTLAGHPVGEVVSLIGRPGNGGAPD